jgi:SAM-dependent methyltransferase
MRKVIGSFLQRRLPVTAKVVLRRMALRVAGVAFAGSGVACPCCGHSFRRLAPFKGRQNEQCPACGSLTRHRALFLFLSDELELADRTARVLHFAPERALQLWLSSLPHLEYLSADLDSPLALVRMDITDIPCSDARFDLIICSHVLEHVGDDRRAIHELYRVLASGGEAIVQVPIQGERTFEDPSVTDPRERARVFGQYDHVRIPGRDYVDRLAAAGFLVEERDIAREVDEETCARHALKPGELFYRCRKPSEATPGAATREAAGADS